MKAIVCSIYAFLCLLVIDDGRYVLIRSLALIQTCRDDFFFFFNFFLMKIFLFPSVLFLSYPPHGNEYKTAIVEFICIHID